MSQQVLAGVGNYIKAEALFKARISPHRVVSEISEQRLKLLYQSCREIALEAYLLKGNSFHSFVDSEGKRGTYSDKLLIYRQKIDPYGNKIIKEETKDGRTTHWSDTIQT